jgi:hypothetical protein
MARPSGAGRRHSPACFGRSQGEHAAGHLDGEPRWLRPVLVGKAQVVIKARGGTVLVPFFEASENSPSMMNRRAVWVLLVIAYISIGVAIYVIDDLRNHCGYEVENARVLFYAYLWPFRLIGLNGYFCAR